MKELLDSKNRKKVAVIEEIYYSKNHSCPQVVLLEQLNITYPTLISIVERINEDIINFGFDNFSIIHHPSNQLYSLDASKDFSVQLVIHAYVRSTVKFRLLELLLTNSFENLQSLLKPLYISYSSLRKEIRELNQILKQYNLFVSTKNGIYLEGEEVGIRLFYTALFSTLYGGESWPFSYINYFEVTELLKSCPKEVYVAETLDKSILVHFYVAIHLLRVKKNNLISNTYQFEAPLYSPYSEESKDSCAIFLMRLKKIIPNVNEEIALNTSNVIFSVLLAFGSYSVIKRPPSFFYLESQFRENGFWDVTTFVCEQVEQHLSIPFSEDEKNKFLYSLMSVNYRYLLFKDYNLDLQSFILDYTKVETNIRKVHKVNHLKSLIKLLMEREELSIFKSVKKEISAEYLLTFEKRIDFSKHTHPIKVAILSIISNETVTFDIKNYFSSYYNLELCDKMESNIDLYISDVALSANVIKSLNITQPIVYVNTRLVDSDYVVINEKLANIATKKFINKLA